MVDRRIPKKPSGKLSSSRGKAAQASASQAKTAQNQTAQGQAGRKPARKPSRSRSAPSANPSGQEQENPQALSPLQKRFLSAVGQSANITQAAELAGVDRSCHYHWLRDPAYRRAFLQARESALDRLELEAWKRAQTGSDRLLIFLLSSYRPRFRQETPPLGPVYHELAEMTEEELLAQARQELKDLGYDSLDQLWGG